ncbi:MAG TPA: hypothetical protein VFG45_09295 [Candidatus Nitrosocosmicus sp.]|nr:hypothetical protein [Candidatus Nitrosocosmicus sp.]
MERYNKKEVRGLNNFDLGKIQGVSNGLVFTQRGSVNLEPLCIP